MNLIKWRGSEILQKLNGTGTGREWDDKGTEMGRERDRNGTRTDGDGKGAEREQGGTGTRKRQRRDGTSRKYTSEKYTD